MEQGSLRKQLSFIAEGPLKLGAKWRKLARIFLCISISLVTRWYHFRRIGDERANLPCPHFLPSWGCLRHRPSPDAWIRPGGPRKSGGVPDGDGVGLRSASAQRWGINGQMWCGSAAFSLRLVLWGKVVSNTGDSQGCSACVLLNGPWMCLHSRTLLRKEPRWLRGCGVYSRA